MTEPLYGVDGNLLVEKLDFDKRLVEAVLDGTFKAAFNAQHLMPSALFQRHPQLVAERDKRMHRAAYRAHLEAIRARRRSG